ncbi:hypothetical protein BDB13_6358 [Rhodococcus sp. OK302]|nr:hypothetical protein BDB13_6358 [Rhodococcus sp. OK302]
MGEALGFIVELENLIWDLHRRGESIREIERILGETMPRIPGVGSDCRAGPGSLTTAPLMARCTRKQLHSKQLDGAIVQKNARGCWYSQDTAIVRIPLTRRAPKTEEDNCDWLSPSAKPAVDIALGNDLLRVLVPERIQARIADTDTDPISALAKSVRPRRRAHHRSRTDSGTGKLRNPARSYAGDSVRAIRSPARSRTARDACLSACMNVAVRAFARSTLASGSAGRTALTRSGSMLSGSCVACAYVPEGVDIQPWHPNRCCCLCWIWRELSHSR